MDKALEFETHTGILEHLPGMRYMFIPAAQVNAMGGGFNRRLVATVNGKVSWKCGLMSLGEGNAYISITQKRMKEAGIKDGDRISLRLEADHSPYGLDVPEELAAVFDGDPEGFSRFQRLKAGKQRYVINYVATVKNPDKRIERALLLINNLKMLPVGKEEFREMLGLPKRN